MVGLSWSGVRSDHWLMCAPEPVTARGRLRPPSDGMSSFLERRGADRSLSSTLNLRSARRKVKRHTLLRAFGLRAGKSWLPSCHGGVSRLRPRCRHCAIGASRASETERAPRTTGPRGTEKRLSITAKQVHYSADARKLMLA